VDLTQEEIDEANAEEANGVNEENGTDHQN